MAFTVTTVSLPDAEVGVAYTTTLASSGGVGPITWSLTVGTLPNGLSLAPSTGIISGTPTAPVSATPLTFHAVDSTPVTPQTADSSGLTLTVDSAVAITTTSLPNGKVGIAYSATLTATGGATPYTWALTVGTLPAGLSLNTSTGVISGTPSQGASNATLTFQVTDADSGVATVTLTLTTVIATQPVGNATPSNTSSPTFPLMPQCWPLTIIPGSDPLAAETQPQSFDTNNAVQAGIVSKALTQAGNTSTRLT